MAVLAIPISELAFLINLSHQSYFLALSEEDCLELANSKKS